MKTFLFLALFSITNPLADANMASFTEPDDELIRLWHHENNQCRGNSGNKAQTHAACAARLVYHKALNERGWCYGREGQASYQMEWHECVEDSLR